MYQSHWLKIMWIKLKSNEQECGLNFILIKEITDYHTDSYLYDYTIHGFKEVGEHIEVVYERIHCETKKVQFGKVFLY